MQTWIFGTASEKSTTEINTDTAQKWCTTLMAIKTKKLATLYVKVSWWRHQMETFSALLAICAGNSPVPGEFPAQRPVTRSFDVFFDLRLNKPLGKQWWGWWFETLWHPLWRHCNDLIGTGINIINLGRSSDRTGSIMVIHIPVRWRVFSEYSPRYLPLATFLQ